MRMPNPLLLIFLFLTTTSTALAQTDCPVPRIEVLRNGQAVPAAGAPPAAKVTVRVMPDPACPDQASFRFRNARLTLMRGTRPLLPTFLLNRPDADLSGLLRAAQPGDRIHVFIFYKDLLLKTATGEQIPYASLIEQVKSSHGQVDLRTDEAQGISFTWHLVR